MPYYKDALDGRFPIYSRVPLDDPRFVEITEAEWDVLRQAGNTEDHPYSNYVLNKDLMAEAARAHIADSGETERPFRSNRMTRNEVTLVDSYSTLPVRFGVCGTWDLGGCRRSV